MIVPFHNLKSLISLLILKFNGKWKQWLDSEYNLNKLFINHKFQNEFHDHIVNSIELENIMIKLNQVIMNL